MSFLIDSLKSAWVRYKLGENWGKFTDPQLLLVSYFNQVIIVCSIIVMIFINNIIAKIIAVLCLLHYSYRHLLLKKYIKIQNGGDK